MADNSEEKTEAPSDKRRHEAREKGNVAKSTEINSVMVLITGIVVLKITGPWIINELGNGIIEFIKTISDPVFSDEKLIHLIHKALILLLKTTLPTVGAILLSGIVANIVQVGFMFTLKPLEPKIEKINPLSGFKRLFSLRSIVETAKNIAKLLVIGIVAFNTLENEFDNMLMLSDASVSTIFSFTMGVAYKIIMRIALVLLIIAILDYAYQRYDHEKKLKMSKQELKEERKQLDGDPQVKSRIKALQREMARRRMMEKVPEATVVITNPTHLAIALKYEPQRSDAPVVVAKGKRMIAMKIKNLAKDNNVPVVEDKPLARAMYDKVDIGLPIPMEFFAAVAEILAYVFRLKNRNAA